MKLKKYLKKHKITLTQLSRKSGIGVPKLHHYMTRKYAPNLGTALVLEKVTDGEVTLRDMLIDVKVVKKLGRLDKCVGVVL